MYPEGKIFYVDYYNDNEVLVIRKTYSRKGDLVATIEFKDDKIIRSKVYKGDNVFAEYEAIGGEKFTSKVYHNDEKIRGVGRIDSLSREYGWWEFFRDKKLIQKRFFLTIGYDQVTTQRINYIGHKLDSLNSTFAEINITKDIKTKALKGILSYTRVINKKSYVSLLIGHGINSNFSNIDLVSYDTISFGQKQVMEWPIIKPISDGEIVRGFIVEQYTEQQFRGKEKVDLLESRIPVELIFKIN